MTKTVAEIIWFLGMVVWYVIRYPFQRQSMATRVKLSLLGAAEWIVLWALIFGLYLIPAVYCLTGFPAELDRTFNIEAAFAGVAALGLALWLFRRSHVDLGKNWSATLKIRENHELVTIGVYRFLRHPMYTSFLLLAMAQMLLLPNWLAGCSGLASIVLLYALRARREEQMMLATFGDAYRAYASKTWRVVPWLF